MVCRGDIRTAAAPCIYRKHLNPHFALAQPACEILVPELVHCPCEILYELVAAAIPHKCHVQFEYNAALISAY
jgi:hypothetical protein